MPSGESHNTTHLTTADADGNVFAGTHTIHALFGSKVTVPGTGMLLNNTMNIFDPHPGFANSIAPGKRMTSSMSPIIVQRDGRPWFALGLPGATKIFPSAMQAIINMIDHQMSPQEAVEAPRVWTQGQELEVEPGLADDVLEALRAMGHVTKDVKTVGGGMNMIAFGDGTTGPPAGARTHRGWHRRRYCPGGEPLRHLIADDRQPRANGSFQTGRRGRQPRPRSPRSRL